MDLLILVLIIAIICVLIASTIIYVVTRKNNPDDKGILLMQRQLQDMSRTLDDRLSNFQSQLNDTSKDMQSTVRSQFGESQKLVQDINDQVTKQLLTVTKGVTEVSESTKQVFTIAEQLNNLEKVLKHQKQRGNLGEASLELSLSNILPPDGYEMQHLFSDGSIVDAIIKVKDGIIPIDAKFSLDNYNRIVNEHDESKKEQLEKDFKNDLKKRIDETAKYIRPKDGTLPFAFMFIPAEGIYYDLLINEVGSVKVNTRSLVEYAYNDKNVIIVSPTTFSAYLQSVLYGFKAFKIEESAKEIQKNVQQLSRHIAAYDEYFKKVGKSLSTTVNHYDAAQKSLGMIDKDITRITGEDGVIEKIALAKPKLEE